MANVPHSLSRQKNMPPVCTPFDLLISFLSWNNRTEVCYLLDCSLDKLLLASIDLILLILIFRIIPGWL